MSKELEAFKKVNIKCHPKSVGYDSIDEDLAIIETALKRLEAIDNAIPSEALEDLKQLTEMADKCWVSCDVHKWKNTIKQTLMKVQGLEIENAEYKSVLNALKKHLHILPMSNGDDVIGIGCPANEDVIEPNDFGYDIIKEWLRKDKSE